MLFNHEGAIYAGHGGAMAGHLSGVYVNRKTRDRGGGLTNSGTRGDMDTDGDPARGEDGRAVARADRAWRPEEDPGDVRPLLGRWWSEGNEFVFWWEDGTLKARFVAGRRRARRDDVRARRRRLDRRSGRERGERLRIEGDRLIWAGYVFTRVAAAVPAWRSHERSTTTTIRRRRPTSEPLPALRRAVPDHDVATAAAIAIVATSTGRNDSGRPRADEPREQRDGRRHEAPRPASTS